MTKLVKLTLKNFKSFKKAELPISKGFTAIVGSNGSGKSNILDALLFVLGITSLKTLRAGKLTDLVNTDAKETYAKVDLVLKDNEKQYEISRMIDKQGKSVYRLDGKRTTLNEILSLLTDLGIDVSGHNIVTQGDITKIIEMSAVERREIIDATAGLSEFDDKKEEAIKELDKVDSRIKEATIILNERTVFLSELEQEMKAAKERTELEDELKRTKATIISRELYSLEKKLLEADNEIAQMNKQKEIVEARIDETRKLLAESKKKSDDLARQMIKASEQTYSTIGREFEEKKAKLMLEQQRIDIKKEQSARNNKKIDENKELVTEAENEKSELLDRQKRLHAEKSSIESQLMEASKKKSQLEGVVKAKSSDLAKEEAALEKLNKEIDEAKKESFDLEVFVRNWEKQKTFHENKLAELRGEEEALSGEIEEIEGKKRKIEAMHLKHPEKELVILEKRLSETLEQKNLFGARRAHEEKAIKELRTALSQCPICDSALKEDKKIMLLKQKEALVEDYMRKERTSEEEAARTRKLISDEKEKAMVLARLSAEVELEHNTSHKISDIRKKIAEIKGELDTKGFDDKLYRRNKLSERIVRLEAEKEAARHKVMGIRGQNVFEEYSAANNSYDEFAGKRMQIESSLNEAKTQLAALEIKSRSILAENTQLNAEIEVMRKEITEREKSIVSLKEEVLEKEKQLVEAKKKHVSLEQEKDAADKKIERTEKEIIAESIKAKKIEGRINEFNIEKSKLGVRQSDLCEEKKSYEGIEPYASKSLEECKSRITHVEKRIEEIGAVNMKAMTNFGELRKEVDDIQQKATKLSDERLAVLDMIDKIEVKRTGVFMECFNEINKNFKEIFFKFFNSEGNLSFANPEKPLESGLMVDAKYKGRLQNIDSMSGGEKTLTALAFMFAIQLYSPAPFYAFDEADAALDKENSLKMSNLIEKIAQKSQFIAITHNDVITKKSDQIIGVARGKDDSSVIGLRLKNNEE
ncbi:Chromosome partition protein Smc [uncultured archaeon]|nr:Chromosome partition protein Smc [uncultured archaeon]